jgi:hypothetical protein
MFITAVELKRAQRANGVGLTFCCLVDSCNWALFHQHSQILNLVLNVVVFYIEETKNLVECLFSRKTPLNFEGEF